METIANRPSRAAGPWLAPALALVVLVATGLAAPASAAGQKTAERFVAAINAGDGGALNELIDVDALGERVLRNLGLNVVDRTRYLAGLRMQHSMLGYSVAAQMAQQKAVAVLAKPALPGAGEEFLVRFTMTDANDNEAHGYFQVELGEDGRIVDWYDHSLAMSISGQLAFSAAGLLTTPQIAQLFFGKDVDVADTAVTMQRLALAINSANMRTAHDLLLQMPEPIKARREFATLKVTFARSIGMQEYRDALAELASRHGDADDLQFILIDHYFLTGRYDLGLGAVERAERIVGQDEVMDSTRCALLFKLERKAEALAACDRSIALNPRFETPRWTKVTLALATKDAPLAIASLTGVEEARQGERLDAKRLAANKSYAWLVAQPEWPAWASERGWAAPVE